MIHNVFHGDHFHSFNPPSFLPTLSRRLRHSLSHSPHASATLYLNFSLPLPLSTSISPCLCHSLPHSLPASSTLYLTLSLPSPFPCLSIFLPSPFPCLSIFLPYPFPCLPFPPCLTLSTYLSPYLSSCLSPCLRCLPCLHFSPWFPCLHFPPFHIFVV